MRPGNGFGRTPPMARWWLLVLASCGACEKRAKAPPAWPPALLGDVQAVAIQRWRGDEAPRRTLVRREANGIWRVESPRRGEADPDAITRLFFALQNPQVLSSTASPREGTAKPSFIIELVAASGRGRRVTIFQAPLGNPLRVRIDGAAEYTVAPVEFAGKVPDPDDLLPPALWPSAEGKETRLSVEGPARYVLHKEPGGEWASDDGRKLLVDLEDVPGVITGRQAVDHPAGTPSSLGLDPPLAVATLCAGSDCRKFPFGKAESGGRPRYFASGPDMDPLEFRDDAWNLLVEGPFADRRR